MSVFKRKPEKKFDPDKDLRMTTRRYIFEGKVLKEEQVLEYRYAGESWWNPVNRNDAVTEIFDAKQVERMGLEGPSEQI